VNLAVRRRLADLRTVLFWANFTVKEAAGAEK